MTNCKCLKLYIFFKQMRLARRSHFAQVLVDQKIRRISKPSLPPSGHNARVALVFMTHQWNEEIGAQALEWYKASKRKAIDMYILTVGHVVSLDPSFNNDWTIVEYEYKTIQTRYETGFQSLWASNHWILLQWFEDYGRAYKTTWAVEYDVRSAGNLDLLFCHASGADVVFSKLFGLDIRTSFWAPTIHPGWIPRPDMYCYKQVMRLSHDFLEHLDAQLRDQKRHAQDEICLASNASQGHFKIATLDTFLSPSWTYRSDEAARVKALWTLTKSHVDPENQLILFHPVK